MNKLTNYTTDKIFERLLSNKSSENYWNYVSELRKRKTDEVFKKSVLFTKSEALKERIIGINVLAQFGYPRLHKKEIIKVLFELLKTETDRNVLSSLFYGIGHNNEKLTIKQVDLLCSFVTHKSVIVRHSLVLALSTIEHEKPFDALIVLSNDKDSDIRDWATFGLGSQNDLNNEKIRNALWARVLDKDEATKFEAILGLAQRKDKRIIEVLITELQAVDNYGSLILESIQKLDDKSFIPKIEQKIIENKTSKKVDEAWLINTLKKLKGDDYDLSLNRKNAY